MLSDSNDLFAPTEAAKPLLFNSGIRTAEGGANNRINKLIFCKINQKLTISSYSVNNSEVLSNLTMKIHFIEQLRNCG